ncbi:hypothetical protein [Moorena producens]|uniref:hypothetical protein n=1 Tax=Moorena producens TaxID=1155739 RepID=UPI003C718E7F
MDLPSWPIGLVGSAYLTPYTLHPTPYTLHPTPYSLLPTPYSLLPFTVFYGYPFVDNFEGFNG